MEVRAAPSPPRRPRASPRPRTSPRPANQPDNSLPTPSQPTSPRASTDQPATQVTAPTKQPATSRPPNKQPNSPRPFANQPSSPRAATNQAIQVAPQASKHASPRPFVSQSNSQRVLTNQASKLAPQASQPASPRPIVNQPSSPKTPIIQAPQVALQASQPGLVIGQSNSTQAPINQAPQVAPQASQPASPRLVVNQPNSPKAPTNQAPQVALQANQPGLVIGQSNSTQAPINQAPQASQPGSPQPVVNQPFIRRAPINQAPRVALQASQPASPRPFANQLNSPRTLSNQATQVAIQNSQLAILRPPNNLHAITSNRPLANQPNSPRIAVNQVALPRSPSNQHNSIGAPPIHAASHVSSQDSQRGKWVRGGGAQRQGGQDPPKGVARIHVSGFPVYTQQQDLMTCFAKFGKVCIEKMTTKYACLAYPTAAEARAAIQSSQKLIMYGEFLTVREFTAAGPEVPPQKQTPKRNFLRSKQKEVIVEPAKIDLSGDFLTQMQSILSRVRLTQEEAMAISSLYADVEKVLQAQWPGCVAVPFGSITTGLGIKTSDADCFVLLPRGCNAASAHHVNRAKRLLQSYPHLFTEILSIPRANTPIVKFFHVPTETNCDLSFKTPLGSQNSRLMAFLLHADPRLIPVSVIIKYWAKVHGLSGTGRLTNYALTMMIIFYLQQPPMSILPSVEWLQRDRRNDVIVDYWNTGFMANRELLPPTSNTSSVSELLGGFFEFYSKFNFEEMVVCPYLGAPIKKEVFRDLNQLPAVFQRYRDNVMQGLVYPMRHTTSMCVQDPFEQSHNVASAITSKLASEIKAYLKFAADAYEKDKLEKCKEFLKKILLEKPKLPKAKAPDYSVHLYPRIMMNIQDEDWKSVVRNVIFTIFETMLKIKLSKVDEKPTPEAKKVKERYTGAVTKPIWKRKQFSRIYSVMNLDFEQKQSRITEEIMNVEKEVLNLQFQLSVKYTPHPKNALVSVKHTEGDNEMFPEFGKLFVSVLQNWFVALLKPEARPSPIDRAAKIAETKQILDGTNEPNTSIDSDDISVTSETTNSRESESEKDSAMTNNNASEIADGAQGKDISVASETTNSRESESEKDSAMTNNNASEIADGAQGKDISVASETTNSRESESEKDSAMTNNNASEIADGAQGKDISVASETTNSRESESEKDSAITNNNASEISDGALGKDIGVASETKNSRESESEKDSAMTNNTSEIAENSGAQGK